MNTPRLTLGSHAWRLALVASGVLSAIGGPMHPDSDARDSLREELATMTADPAWVPGHSLVAVGTVLLAVGLWAAYRRGVWPASVRRPLFWAATAVSVYVVETVAHLAAATDAHALAHGDAAPVAMSHIGLALVLYPITGAALVVLAVAFGRAWGGWRWAIAGIGVLAGLLHAGSVPLTMLLPDVELTPMFAGAGMGIALFSLLTGLVGAPRTVAAPVPEPALAG